MALQNRMARELKMLDAQPPEGICAWPLGESITQLKAQLQGPPGTVYEEGWFQLSLVVPDRFPFEPPKLQFETPVYHPNIDSNGRICLDILNMPPKGAWRPSLTLCTVLAGARQLLAEPNPNDPLMGDVTDEYINNRSLFDMKARALVAKHARAVSSSAADGADAGAGASATTAAPAAPALPSLDEQLPAADRLGKDDSLSAAQDQGAPVAAAGAVPVSDNSDASDGIQHDTTKAGEGGCDGADKAGTVSLKKAAEGQLAEAAALKRSRVT